MIKSYFKKISSHEKKEPNNPENPILEKSIEEQVIVLLVLYLFILTVLHTYLYLFQTLYYEYYLTIIIYLNSLLFVTLCYCKC